MRDRRSGTRAGATAADGSSGLSSRGWIILVAITAVVGVGLVTVGVLMTGIPGGGGKAAAPSTPLAAAPRAPDLGSAPTPRGLPPRPSSTHVATVPSRPVDSLAAGDCLQTYDSKWADGYPVVDCSAPHIAQLLTTGVLPEPAGASFPGADALDTQVSDLCEPFLNWDWVAVWNEDVQMDLRYPNTSEKWATGTRNYYCFVYTFSRHELTGSAEADH